MRIKDQKLTIGFPERDMLINFPRGVRSDEAAITVSFTVDLDAQDMELTGGFHEEVRLVGSNGGMGLDPFDVSGFDPFNIGYIGGVRLSLPLDQAIKRTGISNDKWDLHRERKYIVPRYPYPRDPFAEARFKAYISISPAMTLSDDKSLEGVLPARYPVAPSSALSGVGRIVRRLRYVFGR